MEKKRLEKHNKTKKEATQFQEKDGRKESLKLCSGNTEYLTEDWLLL